MKNRLFLLLSLTFYQAFFFNSGCLWASVESVPDTLAWSWEVTSSTSTKTKSCVLAFSGTLQLDWGDGVVETLPDTMSGKTLTHIYSVVANQSCIAVAQSLTYYKADSRKILCLDPSRAPNLTYLSLTGNQLTSLHLTNNTKIQSLYVASNDLTVLEVQYCNALQTLTCSDNQLAMLDVSLLPTLKKLTCHTNPLTALRVSSGGALSYVSCLKCSLDVAALDLLFTQLPALSVTSASKNLLVLENPGSAGCCISLATNKKWTPDKGLTTCTVYLSDTTCSLGTTAKMTVNLMNPMPVMAFELDIVLPDGIELDTLQTCIDAARKGKHLLSVARVSDTTLQYKFMAYSLAEKDVFAGSSGPVLDLYLKVPNVEQLYTVKISKAVLVDTLTNVTDLITMDGALSVETVLQSGDVNGDESVNVTDIVCLIAYINGRNSLEFNSNTADIDGDGLWNVADVTKLVVLVCDALESETGTRTTQSVERSVMTLYDAAASVVSNYLFLRPSILDSTVLELCLNNVDSIQAYQVDLVLPEGVTLDVSKVVSATERSSRHALIFTERATGCYRLLSYAMTPDAFFKEDSGVLATLPLLVEDGFSSSVCPVYMEDPVLTGPGRRTVSSIAYDCWATVGQEEDVSVPVTVYNDGQAGLEICGTDLRSVTIWDLMGRMLFHQEFTGADTCRFSTGQGVFLVKVMSGSVVGCLQKVVVQ
jgi:hypothetical protein